MLQTNGVTKSDVKEVTKTLIKNAPKWKGVEKNAKDANDMINTLRIFIKIWSYIVGIIFTS